MLHYHNHAFTREHLDSDLDIEAGEATLSGLSTVQLPVEQFS